MAEKERGVAGTELRKGDIVELISGGPPMTVIGQYDDEIRCAFFFRDNDGSFGEMASVALPRAALKVVDD